MASSPASPWAILAAIPRVSATDAEIGGADLSVAPAAPPRVTILTVPPRVSPDPTTPRNFPSVLAADPSGLLLFSASQGRPTGPLIVDMPGRELFLWRPFVKGYFVCDAVSATALRLPEPEGTISHPGNLGLAVAPGGGGRYVVAELQAIFGGDVATLLCFSSETGEWAEKNIEYPLPSRPWGSHTVVSHQGKLCVTDRS